MNDIEKIKRDGANRLLQRTAEQRLGRACYVLGDVINSTSDNPFSGIAEARSLIDEAERLFNAMEGE